MGISGLLPALKSIQRTRHLSEFKGQTIAIDAYVWLHKGVYSCATELATGKPTHKYVDYAMHRVRLLRHFGIEPYVVFDGGPLPAKKGTESERKQRREENLSRGKALAAQGKHSQARDCFVKCIDVTPQMAYQCIKALRAENVQYVVAPYEADAQLAYLERVGLASAILTEDSDLLVFGCKNVLFKLDHVASTVCHISRDDFGSVRSTALDSSSINLHGWNDTQFRAMAILSGCDYLPSIPGIGLKTANNLLRKWKTAEAVVRAIMLEGKKRVPSGYMKQFNLAERCFRFQRVYDPLGETMVHLMEVEGDWDEEANAYVGEDMDPQLATSIAVGNVDPVTRHPMKDINPSFKPQASKSSEKSSKSSAPKNKGKEKAVGGILNFFGPNPVIPRDRPAPSKPNLTALTGTSSGKRRLGEVMELDLASRKQRLQDATQSKFFSTATPRRVSTPRRFSEGLAAGPSRIREGNKENIGVAVDDDSEADILSSLSNKANISPTQDLDLDFDEPINGVEQEDGYMSPLSTYSRETQELSSPGIVMFTPLKKKRRKNSPNDRSWDGELEDKRGDSEPDKSGGGLQDDDFDADPISSPISSIKKRRRRSCSPLPGGRAMYIGRRLRTPSRSLSTGNVLVAATPPQERDNHQDNTSHRLSDLNEYPFLYPTEHKHTYNGPDLQSCLGVGDSEAGPDEDNLQSNTGLAIVQSLPALVAKARGRGPNSSNPRSGSGQESGSEPKSGSTSPLSPSPQTPRDEANLNTAFTGGITAVERKEGITIDVDALEVGTIEMEAEVEMVQTEMELDDDPEENAIKLQAESAKHVARGWRMKWALGQLKREDSSSSSSAAEQQILKSNKRSQEQKKRRQSVPMALCTNRLRRDETNVTPLGKHSLARTGTNRPFSNLHQQQSALSAPPKSKPDTRPSGLSSSTKKSEGIDPRQQPLVRKSSSLVFFDEGKKTPTPAGIDKSLLKDWNKSPKPKFQREDEEDVVDGFSDEIVEISPKAWTALNKFRYQ